MELSSLSFSDHESIPERYAFGKIDAQSHVALADNFNPQFPGTTSPRARSRSLDLPRSRRAFPSRRRQPGRPRSAGRSAARGLFFHWVLVDLAADMREIEEGTFSNGITPRGKGGPLAPMDARQGINSYSSWFANDHDMSGDYFGYDGPCPPWNDALVHRYVFTLYALDVHSLNLQGAFTGEDALRAMQNHVLAKASLTAPIRSTRNWLPSRSAPLRPDPLRHEQGRNACGLFFRPRGAFSPWRA